jgi:hypothetical protein
VKAYLVTTGTLFGLIAVAHALRTFAESSRLTSDPCFYVEGPGRGLAAEALSLWAWRLLRASARS